MWGLRGAIAALAAGLLSTAASTAIASEPIRAEPQFFSVSSAAQSSGVSAVESETDAHFAGMIATAAAVQLKPLTGEEKFRLCLRDYASPEALAFNIMGAGIAQAGDSVPEWGQGMEGYSKRLGSRLAGRGIKHSVHEGLGALLQEDPRYFHSDKAGVWRRALYATGQTFVAHKDSGETRPAFSRFIAISSATYICRQWHPRADRTLGRYFSAGAIWLGIDVSRNVFEEFWPEIKRKFRR